MKRFLVAACIAVGLGTTLSAQQTYQPSFQPMIVSSALPSAPPVSFAAAFNPAPELGAEPASPAASPAPQFPGARDVDYYKWDLGVGYEFLHFKSAPFDANLSGLHTDLTYNFKDWLGVEGNVVSAWGGDVLGGERSKAVLFTGGAHISMGTTKRRWTPWAHILVGGIHMWPQVAGQTRTGFALQPGGGADYRLNDRLSVRVSGDYVYTRLYTGSQNNFQFGAGIVIHF